MDWIEAQQCKRYDDLISGLKKEKTPEHCNGFAPLLRDSVVCLLEGQKLQMMNARRLSFTSMVAIVGSVGMICLTILQLAGKL